MKKLFLCFVSLLSFVNPVFAKYQALFSQDEYTAMTSSIRESCTIVRETVFTALIDFQGAEKFASNPDLPRKTQQNYQASLLNKLEFNAPYQPINAEHPDAVCFLAQARILNKIYSKYFEQGSMQYNTLYSLNWLKVLYYQSFYETDLLEKQNAESKITYLMDAVFNKTEFSPSQASYKKMVLARLYLNIVGFAPSEERNRLQISAKKLLSSLNSKECQKLFLATVADNLHPMHGFYEYSCRIEGYRYKNVFDELNEKEHLAKTIKSVIDAAKAAVAATKIK